MIRNERGFLMLSAIFLTLIVSIMAMIFFNANLKVQQRNSLLYFTALNLANEQFAMLESLAAQGEIDTACHVPAEYLKTFNGVNENSAPVEFKIFTTLNDKSTYTVKVEWTVNGKTKNIESTKTVHLIENIVSENSD